MLVDKKEKHIYVFDELYEKALTNQMIYERINTMGYAKEVITADSSEPKSVAELRQYGLTKVTRARKGNDSILNGIQRIQDYKIIVHPNCVNFLTEISQYQWERDRFGQYTGKADDANNHLMDAMRYGLERINLPNIYGW